MSNISYFNQLVGNGNNGRCLQFNVYEKVFSDISKKINIASQDTILDLGGGCGELTRFMADRCGQIVLADGAEKAIKYAKDKLRKCHNISFKIADITKLPLPFTDHQFDKIICYSVIHYADDLENFYSLVVDLLRITKLGGSILIGDIPLADKYGCNLKERKKNPIRNFLLNQKYYFKKAVISFLHKIKKIDTNQVRGISYTKDAIKDIMCRLNNVEYKFLEQDRGLPLANSREDLLIIKKSI